MLSEANSLTLEIPADGDHQPANPNRVPRRVLHFSDGIIEEYSTDEEDVEQTFVQPVMQQVSNIDPQSLAWVPWFWYQTVVAGSKTLEVCDYLGESLASFFGITTPKYQYEIDYFKQQVEEEEALKREHDVEMGSWVSKSEGDILKGTVNTSEPTSSQRY